MTDLLVRTYKSQSATGDTNAWKNEYVFQTDADIQDSSVRAFVYQWAQFEASLHLQYVSYLYASVGLYADYANMTPAASEIVYDLSAPRWKPTRAGTCSLRDGLALKMRKPVVFGRHGASWLYHCVSDADVRMGNDKRWHLIEGTELMGNFFNGRFALEALFPGAVMAVPRGAGHTYTAAGFQPTRWEVDYIIEAHGRRRGRAKVSAAANAVFLGIAEKAAAIEAIKLGIAGWLEIGTPYVPFDLKQSTSDALSKADGIAKAFHAWAKCQDRGTGSDTVPVARFGPTVDQIDSGLSAKVDIAVQAGNESLGNLHAVHNIDGNDYFNQDDLGVMRDIVDSVSSLAAAYVSYDFNSAKWEACSTT